MKKLQKSSSKSEDHNRAALFGNRSNPYAQAPDSHRQNPYISDPYARIAALICMRLAIRRSLGLQAHREERLGSSWILTEAHCLGIAHRRKGRHMVDRKVYMPDTMIHPSGTGTKSINVRRKTTMSKQLSKKFGSRNKNLFRRPGMRSE